MRRLLPFIGFAVTILLGMCTSTLADTKTQSRKPKKHDVMALLKKIPAKDVYGFLYVHDLQQIKKQLDGIDGYLPKAKMALSSSNWSLLKHRTGKDHGINPHGTAAWLLMKPKKSKRLFAKILVMPVNDYQSFAKHYKFQGGNKDKAWVGRWKGSPWGIAKHGDFVFFCEPEVGRTLETIVDSKKCICDTLKAKPKWLAKQDAGVVAFRSLIPSARQMMKNFSSDDPAEKSRFRVMNKIFGKLEKNVDEVAVGVRIEKDKTARSVAKTHFRKNSPWAKASKNIRKRKGSLFAGVPDRTFAMAFAMDLPPAIEPEFFEFAKPLSRMLIRSVEQPRYPEQANDKWAAFPEGWKELRKLKVSRMVFLAHDMPGKAKFGVCGLVKVANAKKVMTKTSSWLKRFANMAKGIDKNDTESELVKVENQMTKIDGRPAAELVMTYQRKRGKDKVSRWKAHFLIASIDKNTIVFGGAKERAKAVDLIQRYTKPKKELCDNKRVQQTSRMLPKNRHVVGYLDVRGVMRLGHTKNEKSIKNPIPKTAPIGYSGTIYPWGIEEHIVIPGNIVRFYSRVIPVEKPNIRRPKK